MDISPGAPREGNERHGALATAGGRKPMSWLRRNLEISVFLTGLAVMIFLAGMAVGRVGLFPWPIINQAVDAAKDLQADWRHYLGIRSKFETPTTLTGGVTVHDPALAFPGYTLVAAYRSDRPGRYDLYLLDMDGKIVNTWDASIKRVFANSQRFDAATWDGSVEIHGAHLEPNGDVVADLGGGGTVKLDRCSRIVWAVDTHSHHNVEPLPGGGYITPGKIRREEEMPSRPYVGVGASGFYDDDTVLLLGPDGQVRHEESIIDILFRSGLQSVLFSRPTSARRFEEEDPIHLNDIEPLTAELAPAFPMFKAGDLLISLRQTNTLLVVDPSTWTAKWSMTGPFLGQHDPDFMPDGTIMLYDNRITGPTPRFGNSRLLKVNPATKQIVWTFDGQGDQAFYAKSRGEQQLLPNGNILFSDPHAGRILEIAPSAGNRTVWEWHNVVTPGLAGLITDVQRIPLDAAPWLGQPCG